MCSEVSICSSVHVHSVQVVVAVVCNDDLVCMVCKCTAVCHVLLEYIGLLHPCFLPFCLCCDIVVR